MKRIFAILLLVMPLFVVAQNDSGLKKGYKGFFDFHYANTSPVCGFSTTHGWQFNQLFTPEWVSNLCKALMTIVIVNIVFMLPFMLISDTLHSQSV